MEVVYSDTMTVLSFGAIFLIVVTILSLIEMVLERHISAGWKAYELDRIERRRHKQRRE